MPEARLNICPKCGKHGNISCRGGTGPEFGSKSHAAWIIKTGVLWGTVTESEAERIFREIEASSLPVSTADVDPETLWKIELFTARVCDYFLANPNRNELSHPYGECHDFIEQPSPEPMPANFLEDFEETLRQKVQEF